MNTSETIRQIPEDLTGLLQSYRIQPTVQRLQIAAVLFQRREHMSADQVLDNLQAAGGRVSKATVYNTLGLFARRGLIREVIVDPARVYYDPNTSEHHHFYNLDTGELMDIDADDLRLQALPKPPKGTVTAGVDVIIRVRNES